MKFKFNKDFRKFTAGDTVDIPISDDITWVVGSNGSGKSTLMKILREQKDSLHDLLEHRRDGYMHKDTDIRELKPEDVTVETPDYPHRFFLDAVADDPNSLWNSASAYSFLSGGGRDMQSISKGEKSFTMLANFIKDATKVVGNPEDLLKKMTDDKDFIPEFNLVVLDEIDEGMDLKSQAKLPSILDRLSITLMAKIVVITHSIMIPIFAGAKTVFDMDTRSVVSVEEYMTRLTGKNIKITVSE